MKKPLFFAGIILLLLSACKKENNNSTVSTMSATVNGVDENFNSRAMATITGLYTLNLYGLTNPSDNGAVLQVTLSLSDQAIAIGGYTGAPYLNGISTENFKGSAVISYQIRPTTPENIRANIYETINSGSAVTVNITQLTNDRIEGAFNGKVINELGVTKTVTNGKFNLSLLKQ